MPPRAMAIVALPLAVGILTVVRAASQPTFDVASLKVVPFTSGDYRANLGTAVNGQVTLTNATLCECLRYAFSINNDDQIAGPDWIKSRQVRFNVVGKAPAETPVPELRRMLQTLLTDRFKLVIHHEQKERAYLALTVGKKGPKLPEARDVTNTAGNRQIMGAIISNRMSIEQLTTLLSRFLHQPVLDMTGLTGYFDVNLEWTPENLQTGTVPDLTDRPSIFTAVQEQLGLALERRRGPLEVLVVDHADKVPIEN
jgi:uncharacterized protein (TIGR03435 family)